MALADDIADKYVGHTVDLLRFTESVRKKVIGNLRMLELDLVRQIGDMDVGGTINEAWRQSRLQKLLAQTRKTIQTAYRESDTLLTGEMRSLASISSQATINLANKALRFDLLDTTLSPSVLKELATKSLVQGATQKEWWGRQSTDLQNRFMTQMRMGVMAGETNDQLIARVIGGPTGRKEVLEVMGKPRVFDVRSGGLMDVTKHNAESLVRSSVQTVANNARHETYQANDDVVSGEQFLATLDDSTTEICMSYSGETWDLEGNPIGETTRPYPGPPPLHWGALVEKTLVRTSSGLVPIESVRVGDLVWTHKCRLRPVYATMGKGHKGRIIRLELASGRKLLITDDHPVLLHTGRWCQAGNVEVGNQLVEYASQGEQRDSTVFLTAVADNYPVFLHQEFVPSQYAFSSSVFSLRFDAHKISEDKIQNIWPKRDLELVVRETNLFEKLQNLLLLISGILSKVHRPSVCGLCFAGHAERRVAGAKHALFVYLGQLCRRLRIPFSPVLISGSAPFTFTSRNGDQAAFRTGSNGYTIAMHPTKEDALATAQGFIDVSDGTSQLPVFPLDKLSQFLGWYHTHIIAVDVLEYNGDVFNLAVVDDETYLADNLVVSNCRSTLIPILKSWEELGSKIKVKELEEMSPRQQSSMDGQVAADLNYEGWLKTKPEEFQKEVLGEGKWELWNDGKINFTDLVDQSNNPLTLAQLKERAGVVESAVPKVATAPWYDGKITTTASSNDLAGTSFKKHSMEEWVSVAVPNASTFDSVKVAVFDDFLAVSARKGQSYIVRNITITSGKATLENISFFLDSKVAGKGVGSAVFAGQVKNAKALGFTKIHTYASRSAGANGYYTWPRLGYDGPIPKNLMAELPSDLKGAKRLSDLMATENGRSWWQAYGDGVDLTFDLTPGSLSNKILDEYMAARGK